METIEATAPPVKGILQAMDGTGHTQVDWDSDNREEVATAEAMFDAMKAQGYIAYTVGKGGKPDELIKKFDPKHEHIMMRKQMVGG